MGPRSTPSNSQAEHSSSDLSAENQAILLAKALELQHAVAATVKQEAQSRMALAREAAEKEETRKEREEARKDELHAVALQAAKPSVATVPAIAPEEGETPPEAAERDDLAFYPVSRPWRSHCNPIATNGQDWRSPMPQRDASVQIFFVEHSRVLQDLAKAAGYEDHRLEQSPARLPIVTREDDSMSDFQPPSPQEQHLIFFPPLSKMFMKDDDIKAHKTKDQDNLKDSSRSSGICAISLKKSKVLPPRHQLKISGFLP